MTSSDKLGPRRSLVLETNMHLKSRLKTVQADVAQVKHEAEDVPVEPGKRLERRLRRKNLASTLA